MFIKSLWIKVFFVCISLVTACSSALQSLISLQPQEARILTDSTETIISLRELKKDDLIVVKPRERIPADGTIIEGSSEVDEEMLTGESMPLFKAMGSRVFAGTINLNGRIIVRIESIKETLLSKITPKDGNTLEIIPKPDTICIDKTGTLTEEKPSLIDIISYDGSKERFHIIARSIDQASEHMVSIVILPQDIVKIVLENFWFLNPQTISSPHLTSLLFKAYMISFKKGLRSYKSMSIFRF